MNESYNLSCVDNRNPSLDDERFVEIVPSQDTLHPIVLSLMWLNVLLTSGGNMLTIIAFLRDKNIYSKPGNLLILNLAFADLKVGLISLPFYNLIWHNGFWAYGEFVCKLWVIIDYGATIESMLAMLLISWDRLYMVKNIQMYIKEQTRGKIGFVVLISWLLSYSFCFFTVLLVEPITGQRNIDYNTDCDFPPNYYLSVTICEAIILFFIPMCALCYFNTKVFLIIRKRAKTVQPGDLAVAPSTANPRQMMTSQESSSAAGANNKSNIQSSTQTTDSENQMKITRLSLHKDRKAAITLTLLVVTFILCWAPYNLIIILELLWKESVPKPVASFSEYLLWLNSVINPGLYVATNPLFRKQLRKMFSSGLICLNN